MLSDLSALDLSDDACSVIYLFRLNSCQGLSFAFSACHIGIIQSSTILASTLLSIMSFL